jgi:two-component system response regulator DesR
MERTIRGGRSKQLTVDVCIGGNDLRERVCAALVSGGHTIHAREDSVSALLNAPNGAPPKCVVLAGPRPNREAVADVAELKSHLDGASVVIACDRASGGEIRRALDLGVDGIVLTDELEAALPAAVAAACAGQVTVPGSRRSAAKSQVLTTREKQILGLVVMGLTNAQIAGKLYLAESTVKSHLSSAFSKLGVSSRNEAVSLILDPERGNGLGILTIPAEPIGPSA